MMRGKFRIQEDFTPRMPVHFSGVPFYPYRINYGDMTAIGVQFETDEESLTRFIPEAFELLRPEVSVQFADFRDVAWMSKGQYRLIEVIAPVRYEGNDEGLEGVHPLVIWENKACPILGGWEEDGMPKIFADVAAARHVGDH